MCIVDLAPSSPASTFGSSGAISRPHCICSSSRYGRRVRQGGEKGIRQRWSQGVCINSICLLFGMLIRLVSYPGNPRSLPISAFYVRSSLYRDSSLNTGQPPCANFNSPFPSMSSTGWLCARMYFIATILPSHPHIVNGGFFYYLRGNIKEIAF